MNQIGDDLYKYSTPMMSIDDIKSIFDHYDWGIHSYYHSNMDIESDYFFENDLKKCINWYHSNFLERPYIYAFPNNSYNSNQLRILKESGFKHILLVDNKFSNSKNIVHSRFGFDANTFSEAKVKATGFIRGI